MVVSFLSSVTAFIAAHPHLAYAAVLLLALSESIPLIGVFVPGTAVIIAISALVPSGVVTLWPLLAAATAGAIIGDGLSFWIGHRYHSQILQNWPLNRYPELISRSQAFFTRHGDKSVFIARFAPGVRAFIPLIAGILKMSSRRFYVANILSALVWAPSHILPGVLVGASFGLLGPAAKPLAIIAVLVAVVIWAMVRIVRFGLRRGVPAAVAAGQRLRIRLDRIDSAWAKAIASLLDPSLPEARGLALLAALLLGGAWLFFGILEDVVSGDPLIRADASIYQALQALRTAPGDAVMIAITELGDTVVVAAVTVVVFLWLAWKRAWRTAAYWLAAVAGGSALNTVIKVALHRARPGELFYTGWSAFSFPSGHSTVNLILYGFLAFLIARDLRPAWQFAIATSAASFTFLIAFSRLYLGAHWFSDVIGGLAFGTGWLALLGFFYLRKTSEPIGAKALALAGCSALALAGGLNVYRHHALDVERYAVKTSMPTMPAETWWTTGWRQLPAYRIDLTGEIEEPLTVQWAGSLGGIHEALASKGWRDPASWAPRNALAWLTPDADPATLPVVARLASGRLPNLTVVHEGTSTDTRLVLRLWSADLDIAGETSSPVWIGSVVEERIVRSVSLFSWAQVGTEAHGPRDGLAGQFPMGRLAVRDDMTAADWDGRVLLLRQ
ncbi:MULTISPECIES: bifunctional DedA family/phosphatase PAP2 family protein [unclassified Rhizobium]|uniref:bifunctional DedA family/phosphatase PAP2 family protein n=1 Tax=unclassified Rhizobium TaxID=2613769 RepID=UPI00070012B4|nr:MULTISPECIES: bifunctional DedA family/phosphatase PAP2 family protein [unclassified Rhizobium]KQV41752.1 PA-phosphatase [Rhizobium sp. Root1212]KRD30040.1 PA-phosphatase [Rhizobium sp. Root268]